MSAAASEPKGTTRTLHPHQADFVDTVFSSSSKRIVMLNAHPGFGKTTAITFAVARLLRENGDARVLFLGPVALRSYLREELGRRDVSAFIVDRYRFREMLETSVADDLWPRGSAVILSDDFVHFIMVTK